MARKKSLPLDARMAADALEAVAEAKQYNIAFEFANNNAKEVVDFIEAVASMCRIANDLDDGAYVGDDMLNLINCLALGSYYGELFVRHAGAVWTEAEGEDGLEPAVQRGKIIVLPLDIVRRRITDGKHVDIVGIFKRESKAMAKQK